MRTPSSLLKFIGKAVLNQVGGGVAGDFVFEVLPEVARDVWSWWSKDAGEEQRRTEMESLARSGGGAVRAEVDSLVAEIAADKSPEVRAALADYLVQVPAMIRQSMRRPSDPSGRTVPAGLAPRRAEEVQALLPPRMPRFHSGDRPLRDTDRELVRMLGFGGFGEVWLARNPNMPRAEPVALKFCLNAAAAKSLRNEAALLDRVMRQGVHPGIVQLRNTYLGAETPCLEYEYVEGGDLAGLIQDWQAEGGPDPWRAARVAHRLAEIVAFAHLLDPPIVHRDLKPSNVLTYRRGDGSVGFKIADFGIGGIATAPDGNGTKASDGLTGIRGAYTPLYASPEQTRGTAADPRDDVYSLGVIWYQLLTGNLDEGAPTGMEWTGELASRGMSPPLVRLLASCFEHKAAKRLANAARLAEALAAELRAAPATEAPHAHASPAPELPDFTPGGEVANGAAHYGIGKTLGRSSRFALHACALPDGCMGILKIASTPAENAGLDREAFVLRMMAAAAARMEENNTAKEALNYAHFFPRVVDSFVAANRGGRRINVLAFPPEIEEIGQLQPLSAAIQGGRLCIDIKTAAWITGKTLKILAFAHSLGITLERPDADNLLIEKELHGIIVFDWTSAVLHPDESVPGLIAGNEIARAAGGMLAAMGEYPDWPGRTPVADPAEHRFMDYMRRLADGEWDDAELAHRDFYVMVRAIWPRKFHPFTTHPREDRS